MIIVMIHYIYLELIIENLYRYWNMYIAYSVQCAKLIMLFLHANQNQPSPMKKISIVLFLVALSVISTAQEKKFGLTLSGYVKTDAFYDTRQCSAANGLREGHFFLFPDNVLYDADSNDLNDNPAFNILSIQTRLTGNITGPDAFGAKTSGLVETEFYGTSDADISGFRLRHGFVKLNWEKSELLIGQTWHPMFPVEAFAQTLSVNTGSPFVPFSRNNQVRFGYKTGKFTTYATAWVQRDIASTGPDGTSTKYMRNSGLPGLNLRTVATMSDKVQFGLGADFKTLRPELKTAANYATDATISSLSACGWIKFKSDKLTISAMGTYAQNATDLLMAGGYAVSAITDTVREYKTYTNLTTAAAYLDLGTNGPKWKFGVFGGFSKNLGADENINGGAIYARGSNIDLIYRVSPRVSCTVEKLTLGAELEYTTAAYGTIQASGKVTNTSDVSNIRALLCAIYKF